jgi:hypothetical protein
MKSEFPTFQSFLSDKIIIRGLEAINENCHIVNLSPFNADDKLEELILFITPSTGIYFMLKDDRGYFAPLDYEEPRSETAQVVARAVYEYMVATR